MSFIAQPSFQVYGPNGEYLGELWEFQASGNPIPPGSTIVDPATGQSTPYGNPVSQPQIIPVNNPPPSQGAAAVVGQSGPPGPAYFVTTPEMGEPKSNSVLAKAASSPVVWVVVFGIGLLLMRGRGK